MRIGIIGASSQVGSSVAYFLHRQGDDEVTCFLRSPRGGIFFELLGIPSKSLDIHDREAMSAALKDFDVVLDFTYPAGQTFAIKRELPANTERIISAMRPGTAYFVMSSLMAFGMPSTDAQVRGYVLPRSSYALLKRAGEKAALKAGARYGVRIYIFRLSHVHGFLQSVSLGFREQLAKRGIVDVAGLREDLTNTIFPSTIANAVICCARGEVVPGNYSLVSNPQWTLGELYDYYRNLYGGEAILEYAAVGAARSPSSALAGGIWGLIKSQRHLLETYLLINSPALTTRIKGRYRRADVAGQVAPGRPRSEGMANLSGRPARIFPACGSDVATVAAAERQFESLYYGAVLKART